jgi:hypothetical protein
MVASGVGGALGGGSASVVRGDMAVVVTAFQVVAKYRASKERLSRALIVP